MLAFSWEKEKAEIEKERGKAGSSAADLFIAHFFSFFFAAVYR
jgi:hypothetical protein